MILNDQGNHLDSFIISLESFRSFRSHLLLVKTVTGQELFFAVSYCSSYILLELKRSKLHKPLRISEGCYIGSVGPLQCATPATTSAPPVTTSGPPLTCPEGWRRIRDRCLYFSQDFEELASNWNDAKERCKIAQSKSYLVSIRDSTDSEQIFGKKRSGLHCSRLGYEK